MIEELIEELRNWAYPGQVIRVSRKFMTLSIPGVVLVEAEIDIQSRLFAALRPHWDEDVADVVGVFDWLAYEATWTIHFQRQVYLDTIQDALF